MDNSNKPELDTVVTSLPREAMIRVPANILPDKKGSQNIAEIDPEYYKVMDEFYKEIPQVLGELSESRDTMAFSNWLERLHSRLTDQNYRGRSNIENINPGQYRNQIPMVGNELTWAMIRRLNFDFDPQKIFRDQREFSEKELNYVKTILTSHGAEVEEINLSSLAEIKVSGFEDDWYKIMSNNDPLPHGFLYKERCFYAKPVYIGVLLEKVGLLINSVMSKDKSSSTSEEILEQITDIFRTFTIAHPFNTVNNSIIMLIVNYLLQAKGHNPIPHLRLDYEATRMTVEDFRGRFIKVVKMYGISPSKHS